jgi:hypothetical protein
VGAGARSIGSAAEIHRSLYDDAAVGLNPRSKSLACQHLAGVDRDT